MDDEVQRAKIVLERVGIKVEVPGKRQVILIGLPGADSEERDRVLDRILCAQEYNDPGFPEIIITPGAVTVHTIDLGPKPDPEPEDEE